MGAMPCHRNDCEHILCDTYVDGAGYICNYCQDEFKEYLENKGVEDEISEGKMKRHLIAFMKTTKDDYTEGEEINVNDFFQKHTRQ